MLVADTTPGFWVTVQTSVTNRVAASVAREQTKGKGYWARLFKVVIGVVRHN